MKPVSRRDFLKTSVAGTLLAAAPTVGNWTAQGATLPAAPAAAPVDFTDPAGTIYLSDMTQCQPAGMLARDFERTKWQLLDYETVTGIKGAMIAAWPEHDCGELTLPLGVKGPHRIYLGINYTKTAYPEWSPYGNLEAKLSSDPGFRRIGAEDETLGADGKLKMGVSNFNFKSIQEAYWKTADLTGESLVFRQPEAPYNRPEHANITNLSYVKLVPLSAEEQHEWQATRPTADTGRVGMIFCTGQFTGHTAGTYTFHPTNRQWFQDEFTPYANSDIKVLMFEAMRGNSCLFKTRIGDIGTPDNRWPDDWVDPLAEFTRLAHGNGLKIFATLRMIGPQYPMNREPIARASYYWRNPEWAKRDREGMPVNSLSLAYPGVRQRWQGLLREALAYGIDGIQLHLNRSAPFVMYEEPVVKDFTAKYGEDPRQLPGDDPRWLTHCAGYVTQYLREVRALLDEKPGRELGVTIYGEPTKYDPVKTGFDPLRYNCDVDTWLREKLVNYLMPSPYIDLEHIRRWRQIGGPDAHIWPDLMPRNQLPESYAKLAKKYYDAGADGMCVWDGERRACRLSEWAAVQRLGHRDQLDRLAREAPSFYRRVPLKYLAGLSVKESFQDG